MWDFLFPWTICKRSMLGFILADITIVISHDFSGNGIFFFLFFLHFIFTAKVIFGVIFQACSPNVWRMWWSVGWKCSFMWGNVTGCRFAASSYQDSFSFLSNYLPDEGLVLKHRRCAGVCLPPCASPTHLPHGKMCKVFFAFFETWLWFFPAPLTWMFHLAIFGFQ